MITVDLPEVNERHLETMIHRYWRFRPENTQLYGLTHGMDGMLIESKAVGSSAQLLCKFMIAELKPLWQEELLQIECNEAYGGKPL